MHHKTKLLIATCLLLAAPLPAVAGGSDHHAHHQSSVKQSAMALRSPAVKEYRKAMDVMHRDMDIRYTGDADIDFAAGMIPHHQGAVDMVETLLKYGKDPDLRKLALQMKTWQNVEIGIMKRWLSARRNVKAAAEENCPIREYREGMAAMHQAMDIRYTGDADVDFVRGMIPHHQGAIDMAWVQVRYGVNEELRDISRDVIRSQQQEIAIMQDWLKARGK